MLSENIKVSEVSDILRKQLEGIDTRVQLDEIGTVLQVSDGVARIWVAQCRSQRVVGVRQRHQGHCDEPRRG